MARRAGILFLKWNGVQLDVVGDVSYDLGANKREFLVGIDGPHGTKEMPKEAFIEATIRDRVDLKMRDLLNAENATIVAESANGKGIVFNAASFTGDGTIDPIEGTLKARFSAAFGEEF